MKRPNFLKQNKQKKKSWSFELNNALLKIIKVHFKWIEQEVASTFIH
jgi:hypothetical protein